MLTLLAAVALGGIASAQAATISPESALEAGWAPTAFVQGAFTGDWIAHRYAIQAPSIDCTRFQSMAASITVCSITPTGAREQRQRLWDGLVRDRLPSQSVARKGEQVIIVTSSDVRERDKALRLVEPDEQAVPASRFAWLSEELPRDAAGLMFANDLFRADVADLEAKVGIPLDAVYQVDYRNGSAPLARQLSQAAFWVPRSESQLAELSRKLPTLRSEEQTILVGKRAVVAVLSFNDPGRRRLVELLESKGYRLQSSPTHVAAPE